MDLSKNLEASELAALVARIIARAERQSDDAIERYLSGRDDKTGKYGNYDGERAASKAAERAAYKAADSHLNSVQQMVRDAEKAHAAPLTAYQRARNAYLESGTLADLETMAGLADALGPWHEREISGIWDTLRIVFEPPLPVVPPQRPARQPVTVRQAARVTAGTVLMLGLLPVFILLSLIGGVAFRDPVSAYAVPAIWADLAGVGTVTDWCDTGIERMRVERMMRERRRHA